MTNPLLNTEELPEFTRIKAEHVEPAIDELLQLGREKVRELENNEPDWSWENLAAPLEHIDDRLHKAWSPVSHMKAVVSTDALRDAYNRCLPKLSEYDTQRGQNLNLYNAYKSLAQSKKYSQLDTAQRKIVDNTIRDFRLSGIELSAEEKVQFGEVKKKLSELQSKFSDNVLDATQAWTKVVVDKQQLAGLPETVLELMAQTAKQRGEEGYVLTLDLPCYMPIQTYCEDQELRKVMYEAYSTRASDQGPHAGKWDNGPLILEILTLRNEQAKLLGYNNFAELSLATKMAESTEKVLAFLNELASKSHPIAQREMEEISQFAKTEFDHDELNAWDVGFFAEKLRERKYSISQEEVRPYFPAPTVIDGMFEVVGKLYDIRIQLIDGRETWHPDVLCYDIEKNGDTIARFYLDLYARTGKRGGAWMDVCKTRRVLANREIQLPVAYLTCNFTMPVGDRPALLTHNEVVTLFHEFGHGLHHMLTRVEYAEVSGINGVAWDAVELPSQFTENWCWQPEALEMISGHFESGEPLPGILLDKMLAARNFMAAMQMVRQLEFALLDFELHMTEVGKGEIPVQEIINKVREQVAVINYPETNRFQHAFSHIFAGGYAAGYYSYKWAEVLSADAFSRFEQDGIFNRQMAEKFLETILEPGGSREAMELFVEFMGREPEVEALLKQEGIH